MRTHAVLALVRTRVASAFLLSLLVGGALLGDPVPAMAQGRVTFTQLSIERCKGTCTIKLSCSVGGKPASELLAGKQGRTKDLFDIGKSLEVPQFPAEVKCSASARARGSPMSRRNTTEVSSPMATRPSLGNAPMDVAQPMRLSLGVPAKRTHPGPVGPRPLQNPHGLLPDEPPLYRDLRPGSEAELLAESCREGGLALGGDRDDVHAPKRIVNPPYPAMYRVRHCIYQFLTEA